MPPAIEKPLSCARRAPRGVSAVGYPPVPAVVGEGVGLRARGRSRTMAATGAGIAKVSTTRAARQLTGPVRRPAPVAVPVAMSSSVVARAVTGVTSSARVVGLRLGRSLAARTGATSPTTAPATPTGQSACSTQAGMCGVTSVGLAGPSAACAPVGPRLRDQLDPPLPRVVEVLHVAQRTTRAAARPLGPKFALLPRKTATPADTTRAVRWQ